ncbi:hypothetical protein [Legionella waltersii]|uniref:Uncharacterized protein n=1 Tax=Legionella waltersii TaxID=66969 RepID=A0A0W1AAY9_9GAMM|nr:hypothetical protein [Legionella waltersii]KTD78475.1 hypothetical protein Lwal_1910 [Legionella waltersii]SNV05858.1 Uncharacterised protein [Legionella waltersii]
MIELESRVPMCMECAQMMVCCSTIINKTLFNYILFHEGKVEAISLRLSALGLEHQSEPLPEFELMKFAAPIDHLSHVVYSAIEDK